jgi:uncharacterized protein YjdB
MSNQMSPDRSGLRAIIVSAIALGILGLFIGCSSSQVDTLTISPAMQSLAVGATVQFTATGVITHGKHPSSSENVTALVSWTSSAPSVAAISATGLATAVSPGTTTITASMAGFGGTLSTTATVTVTGTGGGTTPGNVDITSVTIIPGSQSVASPGQTSAFIAIGATSNGATEDVTSLVAWTSSSPSIGTVSAAGVATGVSQGTTTITALFTNPDKSIATGSAAFTIVGGTSELVTALTIYPSSQSLTQAQTTQFFVIGKQGASGLQVDETAAVTWTSSDTNVCTVGTTGNGTPGLATAVGAGTSTITATFTNPDKSLVIATATLTVTIGAAQEKLLSINIVPGDTTVSNKGMSVQFLAFGTYSTTPTVRDITNSVTWFSSLPEVAEVDSCGAAASGSGVGVCPNGGTGPVGPSGGLPGEYAGLTTSMGYEGSSIIYALDNTTNADGTVVLSNPVTFTCDQGGSNPPICAQTVPTPQFATVTIFIAGEQTAASGEYVTAPSDTGTPNLIHCGREYTGAGGQVCTGTYAVGSTLTLTENLPAGSPYFGGWSTGSGCVDTSTNPPTPLTAAQLATSTTCTISVNGNATLGGNISAGVIFY